MKETKAYIDGVEIWTDEESDENNGNVSNDEPDEKEIFRR